MYCHNSLQGESSVSCVTPLGEDPGNVASFPPDFTHAPLPLWVLFFIPALEWIIAVSSTIWGITESPWITELGDCLEGPHSAQPSKSQLKHDVAEFPFPLLGRLHCVFTPLPLLSQLYRISYCMTINCLHSGPSLKCKLMKDKDLSFSFSPRHLSGTPWQHPQR